MYNGVNFYNKIYPQYNNGLYDRYNNMNLHFKKNTNYLKNCNFYFSSEEENNNKKANYILTENNRKINNNIIYNTSAINRFKKFNKFITDNSSYSNSQQILLDNEYKSVTGKLNNRYKQFTRKNNSNHIDISLNPYEKNIYSNSHDMGNILYNSFKKNSYHLKNNSDKINKENCSLYGISQINNSSNNESFFYYNGNNTITSIKYNQMFKNHKCQSLNYFNYDNQNGKINNLLNSDFIQNGAKSRVISPFNSVCREMECDPITNKSENCISIKPENNIKSEINTNFEIYQKQRNNFTSNSKNYRNINNTESNNNKNNHAYNPFVNRNKKIEYYNISNRLMKSKIKKENKRRINLFLNTKDNIQKNYQNLTLNKTKEIKNNQKISLLDVPIFNNSVENNNHLLYESKSLSNDIENPTKQKTKNNNAFINSISNKKNENDIKRKKNDESMLKIKLNTNSKFKNLKENERMKKDKIKLRERKINLTELNSSIRNEEKIFLIQKEKQKNITSNNTNKSELNNNKENINININYNKNKEKYKMNNNNAFAFNTEAIKSEHKVIIYMDKDKLNKFQNIKQMEKICDKNHKNIINNKLLKKSDNFVMKQPKKKVNLKKTSISSIYIEKSQSKPIHIVKSNTSYISYVPSAKNRKLSIKEVKRKKRKYSRQNMIQLMNLGNKSFEEDFPFKYNSYMSKINKILKPQIAFRTSLFANKNPDKEKYFIVNFYYSENLRKKFDIIESDF